MTLHIVEGDLFQGNFDLRVITVNCVGAMGAGIHKQFADRYPEHRTSRYVTACRDRALLPGGVMYERTHDDNLWALVATKGHWRLPSQPQWVRNGMLTIRADAEPNAWQRIAMPPLGAGLGGLDGRDVLAMAHTIFDSSTLDVYYFLPR